MSHDELLQLYYSVQKELGMFKIKTQNQLLRTNLIEWTKLYIPGSYSQNAQHIMLNEPELEINII